MSSKYKNFANNPEIQRALKKALKILNLRREYIEEKKQPEKHGEKAQIILPQFTEKKVDWKASTNLNEFHNLMDEEVRGWLY